MMDFATARLKMVESQLRTEDVTDYAILDAMGAVQRERFVPERMRALSYVDEDLPLKSDRGPLQRYLMRPAAFARLLQLADLGEGARVLVVGCATGYSVAVIARLAATVIGLESDTSLATAASRALADFRVANASIVTGPLPDGYRTKAPYDVILVEGAVETVPDVLLEQLAEGGRLAAVVGRGAAASAVLYTRTEREFGQRPSYTAGVAPLPGFEKPKAFVF